MNNSSKLLLPRKFFRRIALFQVALVFFSVIITSLITRYYFKDTFITQLQTDISESLELNKAIILKSGDDITQWCKTISNVETTARYTVILSTGVVTCDTAVNNTQMENHIDRPEIVDAFNNGAGFSERYSDTLKTNMVYGAISISHNDKPIILRKSLRIDVLDETFNLIDRSIVLLLIPIFIILTTFSISRSHRLIGPLRNLIERLQYIGKMSHNNITIDNTGDELADLEIAFNEVENGLKNYVDKLYLENEKSNILIRSISDGILAINKENKILLMNENFRFSFIPAYVKEHSALEGDNLWKLVRNIQVENAYKSVLIGHKKKVQTSIEILHRNNQKGFYDLIVSSIKDAKGENVGAIGIFHDISEKRLTEQMRIDFVTNVSHEVRTPLTAMKGFVQILSSQPDGVKPHLKEYLDRIEQNCERLTHLFNDVLNLSVINSKAHIDRKEIIPEELVSSVIMNVKQNYHYKNIDFQMDITSQKFLGDPLLMEQLLTNLIDNACKYNGEAGIVRISWHNKENSILCVDDDGIGIPEKHWARLFERFYRVDPSRSREMGGTGLGLAIVKHIVLKHNGKIDIGKSELGGSQFKVELPLINELS